MLTVFEAAVYDHLYNVLAPSCYYLMMRRCQRPSDIKRIINCSTRLHVTYTTLQPSCLAFALCLIPGPMYYCIIIGEAILPFIYITYDILVTFVFWWHIVTAMLLIYLTPHIYPTICDEMMVIVMMTLILLCVDVMVEAYLLLASRGSAMPWRLVMMMISVWYWMFNTGDTFLHTLFNSVLVLFVILHTLIIRSDLIPHTCLQLLALPLPMTSDK